MKPTRSPLPPTVSRPWLATAGLVWFASWVVGIGPVGLLAVGAVFVAALITRHGLAALMVALSVVTSLWAGGMVEPLPDGDIVLVGKVSSSVVNGPYGPWVFVDTDEGPVLVETADETEPVRGSFVTVAGVARGKPGVARGVSYRGVLTSREMTVINGPVGFLRAGQMVRDRVLSQLAPLQHGRALLAGFLIGDTTGLDEVDVDAMRRAGLSHFTAVSGSNVALFLGLVFVASGPLSLGPKRRAVVGLLVLPVYAAATGFEPSVSRAAVMAGLVLFGRLIGLSLEAWQVLSLAVIGLILIDPAIATSAGFQLSVAATAGVLIGARWPITGGGGARPLAVTLGAQVAVAPLLLLYFHRVPLLSPAINLVAAPVVTVATLLGSIGVAIVPGLIPPATFLADLTLSLANGVAGWPQIGALEVVVLMAVAVIVGRYPKLRAPAALAVSLAVVFVVVLPRGLPPNTVTVLDVGQGDAILISGGEGRYALVDGGPDPATLLNLLREHGVRHLDLVVLTHLHADHAKGLAGLVGRIGVDRVWADSRFHDTPASEEFFEAVSLAGIPVARPDIAETTRLGGVLIEVLAPSRRFASSNDQSIVLMVTGPRLKMLLSGDVEVTAQSELGVIKADVLKVPHHGGATSDPHWLEATGANLAVISVGDNGFGHPAPSILDLFSDLGTEVLRTDRDGDVVVPLG